MTLLLFGLVPDSRDRRLTGQAFQPTLPDLLGQRVPDTLVH